MNDAGDERTNEQPHLFNFKIWKKEKIFLFDMVHLIVRTTRVPVEYVSPRVHVLEYHGGTYVRAVRPRVSPREHTFSSLFRYRALPLQLITTLTHSPLPGRRVFLLFFYKINTEYRYSKCQQIIFQ